MISIKRIVSYWPVYLLAFLCLISIVVGNINIFSSEFHSIVQGVRIPRTVALLLCGSSVAIAGVIIQQITNNKFVEPSTTGTVECSALAMLLLIIFFPTAPVYIKLIVCSIFSLIGTGVFLILIKRIPVHNIVIVPVVGIIYAGVLGSVVTLIAYKHDLLQTIWIWIQGDFSTIIVGRYELLWIGFICLIFSFFIADRLTLVSLGEKLASNFGINYKQTVVLGLILVSLISAVTVSTVGVLPFLGLVVPNLVSHFRGDNFKKNLWIMAYFGALLVLSADILARIISFPYEIPVSVIMGVLGSVLFLYIIYLRFYRAQIKTTHIKKENKE